MSTVAMKASIARMRDLATGLITPAAVAWSSVLTTAPGLAKFSLRAGQSANLIGESFRTEPVSMRLHPLTVAHMPICKSIPEEDGSMKTTLMGKTTRRIFLVIGLVVFCFAAPTGNHVQADEFGCYNISSCPIDGTCSGSFYSQEGCSIECYSQGPGPGQIQPSGKASCSLCEID
jgi:hypothetical protein